MVSVLPKSRGFPQRHFTDPLPSRYLIDYIEEEEYGNLSRSPVNLELIRKDIFQYRNRIKQPANQNLRLAICLAKQEFQLPERVKMLHLNEVFTEKLPIWESSPGLPWTTYGYKTKGELRIPSIIKSVRWFWHRIKYGDVVHPPDACAFVRSHIVESGETKVRAVWGYPATITFGEAVFALPLIEAYKNLRYPTIAYGYETAIGGTKKILHEVSQYKYGVALDFKSFDKTVPSWLIDASFDILASNIDFMNYRGYGTASASRNYAMFEYIKNYFIHTTIRLCNGERFRKHSGVASGSYFTQLIDSIVNWILLTWAFLEHHGSKPEFCRVFGDDSIIGTKHRVDLDSFSDLYESIGMKINLKKSLVTSHKSELSFLGFKLNNGFPTKETREWFAALMFPERRDESFDDAATRTLGLLYCCGGLDYRFDAACRRILSIQKFELNWSRSMKRFLAMFGIAYASIDCTIPSHLDLAIRYIR